MSTNMSDALRIQLEPPTLKLQEVAKTELRESPELIRESIVALRELIRAEKELHFRDDDEFLMIFLRPTKFYPESAFQLVKRVCNFKTKHANLIDDLLPSKEQRLFHENIVNVLRNRDQLGRRVFVINVGGVWDPKRVSADEGFKTFYIFHQGAILEPQTQVAGLVVILDFEGLSMKQVVAITPSYAMRLLEFIQDALPLRLKNVHIVKQPFLFNMVYQLFKPFIRAKLKSRLIFHGNNMASLHEYIHPDYLPENYGGTLPRLNYGSGDWLPEILKHEQICKAWNTYGYKKA